VSRFLLLLVFLIWMAWRSETDSAPAINALDLTLFFGMYLLLVAMLGMWSRLLARRIRRGTRRGMRYFHRVTNAAQFFVPIWLGIGIFFLGWGPAVQAMLGPIGRWPVQLPGALIGTLPALLTWMGLWWSQYPADRALRDQEMLVRLDQDLPISTTPPFGAYFQQNLRMQILFLAAPILLILSMHDVVMVALWRGFMIKAEGTWIEGVITLCSALSVFIASPLLLARILGARPLPRSPLRDKMEAMCAAHRLRFRDILLWPTHNRIANALVMGVAPRCRYVLLSDLLLSEMTDEQIEAVFAHELGHVVHRHMIWYLVFMKVLILALAVVAAILAAIQQRWLKLPVLIPPELMMTLIGFGGFVFAFGYVSRRFERQADVFAARTLERQLAPAIHPLAAHHPSTHVGPTGASIFASALHRVATINNMPLGSRRPIEGSFVQRLVGWAEQFADLANNWLHGSIATRMRALHRMSTDPLHTRRFDRGMARLYLGLLIALVASGTLAWVI
jgi:STE24 endopeptidase